MICLLADVGGTYTRLALWREGVLGEVEIRASDSADDIHDVLAAARRAMPEMHGVSSAAVAAAGLVLGDRVRLTNLGQTLEADRVAAALRVEHVVLINDLAALAAGISDLPQESSRSVCAGTAAAEAARVVIGVGTGLGVAARVRSDSGWAVVSGEGGHVSLAAHDDETGRILGHLWTRFEHVSAERVLAGTGMLELYRAVCELNHDQPRTDSPAGVPDLARRGDAGAVRTVDLYMRWLGAFAGDVALTFAALGGVYLAGGALNAMRTELEGSGFCTGFCAKGRYATLLSETPVWLITDPEATLRGLAAWASQRLASARPGTAGG